MNLHHLIHIIQKKNNVFPIHTEITTLIRTTYKSACYKITMNNRVIANDLITPVETVDI